MVFTAGSRLCDARRYDTRPSGSAEFCMTPVRRVWCPPGVERRVDSAAGRLRALSGMTEMPGAAAGVSAFPVIPEGLREQPAPGSTVRRAPGPEGRSG